MTTKKALGKGLSALLRDREEFADSETHEIDVSLLRPNPFQPREVFSDPKIDELAQSIRTHGFVQPIVVRPEGQTYQIVAGERRWRAARRLGLIRVPVIIRQISDDKLLEVSLIENVQRENLNAIEEAKAYHRLANELGLTQEEVAQRTGKDRTTITNLLRLLKLPKVVQDMVLDELISMGHARALLSLDNAEQQRKLAERTNALGWSVRQLERFVASHRAAGKVKKNRPIDPNVKAAIKNLERSLGTRVRILEKGKRGKIQIEYYSPQELQRLYERLTNQPPTG